MASDEKKAPAPPAAQGHSVLRPVTMRLVRAPAVDPPKGNVIKRAPPAKGRSMLARYLPILDWGRRYDRGTLTSDLLAALIVTIMLIPQSLAYAMLAGLPPVVGLYASILPLTAYAVFGTSRTLAVGPVAVVSLLTATAAGAVAAPGSPEYLAAAIALALLSGLMLLAMGVFRLGFVANLLSHPVISGFITASGILIATSQLEHILGVQAGGHTLVEVAASLVRALPRAQRPDAGRRHDRHGVPVLGALGAEVGARPHSASRRALRRYSPAPARSSRSPSRSSRSSSSTWPPPASPSWARSRRACRRSACRRWTPASGRTLLPAAFLIAIIGFVESVSVAQTLAAKRRQSIRPDQELIGLGAANLAAAFSGGYPVTGGFARSVVNFDAGAETPAAGAFTAVGIARGLAVPDAAPPLPADRGAGRDDHRRRPQPRRPRRAPPHMGLLAVRLRRAGRHHRRHPRLGRRGGHRRLALRSRSLLHLWRTSRPHVAVIGQIPGTQHFRNVLRHDVVCVPEVLSLRIDESLYFGNARAIEDVVQQAVVDRPDVRHVVLNCAAVNGVDASALESLELILHRLYDAGIRLHLAEVKGPVMDRLAPTDFVRHLSGRVFLSHHDALAVLAPEPTRACNSATRPTINAARVFPECREGKLGGAEGGCQSGRSPY